MVVNIQDTGFYIFEWFFFFFVLQKFSLLVAMATNYISDLDKIHVVGRGLLQKHFIKIFVKISAVTQK